MKLMKMTKGAVPAKFFAREFINTILQNISLFRARDRKYVLSGCVLACTRQNAIEARLCSTVPGIVVFCTFDVLYEYLRECVHVWVVCLGLDLDFESGKA